MKQIYIHGLGQTSNSWNKVIEQLEDVEYSICPDLAELVQGQEITYQNLYAAFSTMCDAIEGDISLCGLSLGGVLALNYAIEHSEKVKSLVLIAIQYKMPKKLSEKFEKEYDINIASVIDNIYHKTQTSRYLASFSKFAYENKEHYYIKAICSKCFDEFIEYFILRYETSKDLEIGFVGSIAYYFQDTLNERIENQGLKISKIVKNPIEGLIEYHSHH